MANQKHLIRTAPQAEELADRAPGADRRTRPDHRRAARHEITSGA